MTNRSAITCEPTARHQSHGTNHNHSSSDIKIFRYIFGVWLSRSKWELDDREHFELLPPGYRPDDPNAEEELWIPLR